MSCTTELGLQVEEVVKGWMDGHTQLEAVWNVCEVHRAPGDVIISIHRTDGVRRLTPKTSKTAQIITPEVAARILNWLDTLSQQPLVDAADLSWVLKN
jgi:hypothetical protein